MVSTSFSQHSPYMPNLIPPCHRHCLHTPLAACPLVYIRIDFQDLWCGISSNEISIRVLGSQKAGKLKLTLTTHHVVQLLVHKWF